MGDADMTQKPARRGDHYSERPQGEHEWEELRGVGQKTRSSVRRLEGCGGKNHSCGGLPTSPKARTQGADARRISGSTGLAGRRSEL